MKNLYIKLCLVFFIAITSCGEGIKNSVTKVQNNIEKDSIKIKKTDTNHFVYNTNYFVNSISLYKNSNSEELKEELEFLDDNIAFFKFNESTLDFNIDSLFTVLYFKAFQPSDSAYYHQICSPKTNKKEELTIKEYGKVVKYSFLYQTEPACQSTKPTLLINEEKKEVIIIESDGVLIKNNGKNIKIIFSTRGNISSYLFNYDTGIFICKNI